MFDVIMELQLHQGNGKYEVPKSEQDFSCGSGHIQLTHM